MSNKLTQFLFGVFTFAFIILTIFGLLVIFDNARDSGKRAAQIGERVGVISYIGFLENNRCIVTVDDVKYVAWYCDSAKTGDVLYHHPKKITQSEHYHVVSAGDDR